MFTADLKEISTALAFIKRATGYNASRARNSVPEITMARLDVDALGRLTVGLFDYETAAHVVVPAEGEPVSTAVRFNSLVAAIKTVGGKGVATFEVTIKGLRITAAGAATMVPVFVGDLPALPELVDPRMIISTTGPAFAEAAAAVAASVGTDDTLPMLTGVRVESGPAKTPVLVTTDRFKLTVAEIETSIVLADNVEMLVPGRELTAFGKAAAKHERVEVTASVGEFGRGWVTLESDTLRVTARLLDCEFPKFRQLLPKPDDYVATLTVDTAELAKRFKAMSATSRSVRLTITPGGVAANGSNYNSDHVWTGSTFTVDTIESRIDDNMVIAFSTDYLADLLAAAPRGTKAALSFIKPGRPMAIEYGAVKAMLMPVRIPGNDDRAK